MRGTVGHLTRNIKIVGSDEGIIHSFIHLLIYLFCGHSSQTIIIDTFYFISIIFLLLLLFMIIDGWGGSILVYHWILEDSTTDIDARGNFIFNGVELDNMG